MVQWKAIPSCLQLEIEIYKLFQSTNTQPHHGFCLIKPKEKTLPVLPEQRHVQVLLLPPQINVTKTQRSHRSLPSAPSINIIMLDSLSRDHFYRSLPLSVGSLKQIKHVSKANRTRVLDFKYFQSIKPRTHETLQVLFSGEILELIKSDVFEVEHVPMKPIKAGELLLPLKEVGYRVLWMEDLCWRWEWGMGRHFGVNTTDRGQPEWNELKMRLMEEGVDDMGVSLANCEIFNQLNYTDPFRFPTAMCVSGKSYHEFLFEHLRLYQNELRASGIPFLTFFMSNLAHEATGERIQVLDTSLSSFITESATYNDTLTIILSDHGNTYGKYPEKYIKGRLEIFNPLLFMILPDGVQSVLAKRGHNMEWMVSNQASLVTVLDLHLTLRTLHPTYLHPNTVRTWSEVGQHFPVNLNGLLESISPNRSCADLPLLQPNLCICENFAIPRETSGYYRLVGEFALGMLNRRLAESGGSGEPSSALYDNGGCPRLGSRRIDNIMESHKGVRFFTCQKSLTEINGNA